MTTNWKRWICIGWLCLLSFAANAVTPQIAVGAGTSCAINSAGVLRCWGNDSYGQLGRGRATQVTTPVLVGYGFMSPSQPGDSVISTKNGAVLALKADGSLWTWGANDSGQLGDGSTTNRSTPLQIGAGYSAVASGATLSLAVKVDGSLWAWGTGQTVPTQIGTGFSAVAAGEAHFLALKSDGSLWAWGHNRVGQLGDGTTNDLGAWAVNWDGSINDNWAKPKQVGTGYVSIAAGPIFSLALKADGSLWAWGDNRFGQLGVASSEMCGAYACSTIPLLVGQGYSAIAAGGSHNLALKTDGSLWAWGTGTNVQSGEPVAPTKIGSGYSAIAAGSGHSVALKSDGSLWAWGDNTYGQLGDGTTTGVASPKFIGDGYVAIAASDYTLAIKSDGTLWAWGNNTYGQLGDGAITYSVLPGPVAGNYLAVSVGYGHILALQIDGSLWAWGLNSNGQLGNATGLDSGKPIKIGSGYSAVSAGYTYSLALKPDGSLWAWGWNGEGQFGDGTTTEIPTRTPKQIGVGYSAIYAGLGFSLALKTDGSLWAWGRNEVYQLGVSSTDICPGNTPCSMSPLRVGEGYSAIAAGMGYVLARKTDGSLWSWGGNGSGQLGTKSTDVCQYNHSCSKVPLLVGTGYAAVAAGNDHSVALKADGSLWTWGGNAFGQLGYGATGSGNDTPRQIGTGYEAIAAGGSQTLALRTDGTIESWGRNDIGQVGDGTLAVRSKPVLVVNDSGDGFLDLTPDDSFEPPPNVGVPFFVTVSGRVSAIGASVSTKTKFNSTDEGKSGSVYVTGVVPPGSLVPAPSSMNVVGTTSASNAVIAANQYVLVQLTNAGWQAVSNGQLTPYASGVLGDQISSQTILNGTDTTDLTGAQFCVGYGTGPEEMLAAGRMRVIASIPNPNTTDVAATSCLPPGPPVSYSINLPSGWNLLGNSLNQSLTVPSLFNDTNAITSVWKWDANVMGWQFYTPQMTATELQAYAASKGYAVLTTINPGEGYWVNAKSQPSLGAQSGDSFILTGMNLAKGWNLVATGNDITPTGFNNNLKSSAVPASLTTLWAWDNASSKWFFYAPSLEAQGGTVLSNYIQSKGYQDFTSNSKKLGNGTGFWVNR